MKKISIEGYKANKGIIGAKYDSYVNYHGKLLSSSYIIMCNLEITILQLSIILIFLRLNSMKFANVKFKLHSLVCSDM